MFLFRDLWFPESKAFWAENAFQSSPLAISTHLQSPVISNPQDPQATWGNRLWWKAFIRWIPMLPSHLVPQLLTLRRYKQGSEPGESESKWSKISGPVVHPSRDEPGTNAGLWSLATKPIPARMSSQRIKYPSWRKCVQINLNLFIHVLCIGNKWGRTATLQLTVSFAKFVEADIKYAGKNRSRRSAEVLSQDLGGGACKGPCVCVLFTPLPCLCFCPSTFFSNCFMLGWGLVGCGGLGGLGWGNNVLALAKVTWCYVIRTSVAFPHPLHARLYTFPIFPFWYVIRLGWGGWVGRVGAITSLKKLLDATSHRVSATSW